MNLLVGVVPASCIVKLSDDEMEKQVDKVVAKGGQAVHKVVEPGSKYLCFRSSYLILVIFFTRAKFLENKIYNEKTRKYTVNCHFFTALQQNTQ